MSEQYYRDKAKAEEERADGAECRIADLEQQLSDAQAEIARLQAGGSLCRGGCWITAIQTPERFVTPEARRRQRVTDWKDLLWAVLLALAAALILSNSW